MSRADSLAVVYLIVAFGAFIPFTAIFGGLPDDKMRWPNRLMIACQVVWLLVMGRLILGAI